MGEKIKNKNGITLVALVITVIILIILASISLNFLVGNEGLIEKAKRGAANYIEEEEKEQQILSSINLDTLITNKGQTQSQTPDPVSIPEGLEIGSTVSYSPVGTYEWRAEYCSTNLSTIAQDANYTSYDSTNHVGLLDSSTDGFKLEQWKVLSINEDTGIVQLVPTSPTSSTVYLSQAQGYNNGINMLNEACAALYGNGTTIRARSINMNDFEGLMNKENVNTAKSNAGWVQNVNTNEYEPVQKQQAYTSNRIYPLIYQQEEWSYITNSGVTTEVAKGEGLGMSDSNPNGLIQRNVATVGTATSIRTYHTYYYMNNGELTTALGTTKSQLILPNGTSTNYWIASRCIISDPACCGFFLRYIVNGTLHFSNSYDSGGGSGGGPGYLFPIVELNVSLITGDSISGFSVTQQ